jgi:hypothetical protein
LIWEATQQKTEARCPYPECESTLSTLSTRSKAFDSLLARLSPSVMECTVEELEAEKKVLAGEMPPLEVQTPPPSKKPRKASEDDEITILKKKIAELSSQLEEQKKQILAHSSNKREEKADSKLICNYLYSLDKARRDLQTAQTKNPKTFSITKGRLLDTTTEFYKIAVEKFRDYAEDAHTFFEKKEESLKRRRERESKKTFKKSKHEEGDKSQKQQDGEEENDDNMSE